jgi:hypothetical protein
MSQNCAELWSSCVKSQCILKMMDRPMTGIVEILFCRCAFLSARKTMHYAAHHFLQTLYSIENALHSCIEFCSFNPFVVGSTPAGPTIHKTTLCKRTPWFFFALTPPGSKASPRGCAGSSEQMFSPKIPATAVRLFA